MAVTISRAGNTATVSVTVDVTDLAAANVSLADKKLQTVKRALQQLGEAVGTLGQSDADLDAQVTVHHAEVARLKAARPSGAF